MSGTATGYVRQLHFEKKFGFIQAESGSYFFHISSLVDRFAFDRLFIGAEVSFTPTRTDRGQRAEDVRVLGSDW
jgi:cold shock CspA family protein